MKSHHRGLSQILSSVVDKGKNIKMTKLKRKIRPRKNRNGKKKICLNHMKGKK